MSDFAKDTNVPVKDIVYRQDVEDMLQNALPSRGMWEIEGDVVKNTICETVVDLMMDLEKVPSAQPSSGLLSLSSSCISIHAPLTGGDHSQNSGGFHAVRDCQRKKTQES